jgi:hypothetical protein
MHALLQQHFDASVIYPHRGIGESGIIVDKAAPLPEMPLPSHSVISGHFPFWWLKEKGLTSDFCFTVLRDPVERVISHYFFKLKNGYPSLGRPVHSPLDVVPNLMCRMLSSDPALEGEALFKSAIYNLERLDFIVFLDDFEGGARRLFKKMGFEHKGEIPKLNQTARKRKLDDQIVQKIRECNDLDLSLYEYATQFLRHKSF